MKKVYLKYIEKKQETHTSNNITENYDFQNTSPFSNYKTSKAISSTFI